MFNIHSTELLLVCIVALLVIGPERLPAAIRTVSLWIARFRRNFNKVKDEIEREINADEIRRQIHNEAVLGEIEAARTEAESGADEVQAEVKAGAEAVKEIKDDVQESINRIERFGGGKHDRQK